MFGMCTLIAIGLSGLPKSGGRGGGAGGQIPHVPRFRRPWIENVDEFPTQNAKTGFRERIICCVTKCFYEYQSKADEIVDFSLSFSKQVHRKVPSMQYFTADVLQESFIVHIRKSAEHEWYFGVSKQSSCFSLTEKHLSLLAPELSFQQDTAII